METKHKTIIFVDSDPLSVIYATIMRRNAYSILSSADTRICDITIGQDVSDVLASMKLHKGVTYHAVIVYSSRDFKYKRQVQKINHAYKKYKNLQSVEELCVQEDGQSKALQKIIKGSSLSTNFIDELKGLQKVVSGTDSTKWDVEMYNDIIMSHKLGLIKTYAGAVPEDLDSFDVILAPFRNALDKALRDRIKYVRDKIQTHIPLTLDDRSGKEDGQIIAHVIMAEQHFKHIIQGAMTLRSAPDLLIVIDTTNRAEKIHYVSKSKETIYHRMEQEGSVELFATAPDLYIYSKTLPYGNLLEYISKLI